MDEPSERCPTCGRVNATNDDRLWTAWFFLLVAAVALGMLVTDGVKSLVLGAVAAVAGLVVGYSLRDMDGAAPRGGPTDG
jgi:hypothetical protein